MKITTNKWFTALVALTLLGSSCNKFLDVQPTGTLIEDKQFEDLQGFYDALYGVYGSMAKKDLYGQHLSWGFVDRLGQITARVREGELDYDLIHYRYGVRSVRNAIDAVWTNQYKAISYANTLLAHCEKTTLTSPDIQWVRAEAMALRAYMHFDLLRLYCDDYRRKPESQGLPYAYVADLKNKKVYTLAETYANILADLDEAERLLADDNTIAAERNWSSSLRAGRVAHINKYAVKALKARVYNAMGDATNAIKYAKEVIASGQFALATSSTFAKVRRFPAEGELIFGLHNVALSESIVQTFLPAVQQRGDFAEANLSVAKLYNTTQFTPDNTDIRYNTYYLKKGGLHSFTRLMASEEELKLTATSLQGLCLIRLPEMYYILAGNLYATNPAESRRYLNELRQSRGLSALPESYYATQADLDKELLSEYLREFPGEGQAFYALKYYNQTFTDVRGNRVNPSDDIFVLPWPEKELEFGNK